MKIFLVFALFVASATGLMDVTSLDMKKEMESEAVALYTQQSVGDNVDQVHLKQCIGSPDPSKINFYLYTKEQPEKYVLHVQDNEALKKSTFKTSRITKFVIHGWYQEGANFTEDFKSAYLAKEDYNVIGVDWSSYSFCIDYHKVATFVPKIGETVALMMLDLKEYGADVSTFHMIGHSLGAQVAAYAGKSMISHNLKLQRITGLDPAGPYYANQNADGRLDKSDANFVDVIHTNCYIMGSHVADGHANFYPNGGVSQMACKPLAILCNHQSSVSYYVESITNPKSFCSLASQSYFDYLTHNYCSSNGDRKYMGEYVDKSASGFYYLITNESKPYGMDCKS